MKRSSILKLLAVAVALTGVVYLGVRYDLQSALLEALTWIRDLGVLGPLVFAVMYVIAAVALVPGSILTLGAGVIFGVLKGTMGGGRLRDPGSDRCFLGRALSGPGLGGLQD